MKKNTIIWGVAGILIVIAVLFATGIFSVVDTFDNCRIVKEGDVCSDYTECVYSSELDASCIKGYEDKTPIFDYSFQGEEVLLGDKGGYKYCTPDTGFTHCWIAVDTRDGVEYDFIKMQYNVKCGLYNEIVYITSGDRYQVTKFNDEKIDTFVTGWEYWDGVLGSEGIEDFTMHNWEGDQNLINIRLRPEEIKPMIVFWSSIEYDEDFGGGGMGVGAGLSNLNYNVKLSELECTLDSNCGENQFCNNTNPYLTHCQDIDCRNGEIINHICIPLNYPQHCMENSANISWSVCSTYLKNYIVYLDGLKEDKLEEIALLQITLDEKLEIISQLELELSDLIEIQEQLELTIEEQALLISSLELTIEEQVQYINQLELTIEEQIELIDSLELTIEQNALLISNLEISIEEQAEIILGLTNTIDEQEIYIAELYEILGPYAEIIKSLQLTISEQSELISGLELTISEQSELISQLELTVEEQAQLIDGLELTVEEQAQLISELELTVEEQAELILQLELTVQEQSELISELEIDLSQKILLIGILQSEIDGQIDLISRLEVEIHDLGFIIKGLKFTWREQAQIIKNLELTISEQAELISELGLTIEEQVKLIEALELGIDDANELIIELSSDIDEVRTYANALVYSNQDLENLIQDYESESNMRAVILVSVAGGLIVLIYIFYKRSKK